MIDVPKEETETKTKRNSLKLLKKLINKTEEEVDKIDGCGTLPVSAVADDLMISEVRCLCRLLKLAPVEHLTTRSVHSEHLISMFVHRKTKDLFADQIVPNLRLMESMLFDLSMENRSMVRHVILIAIHHHFVEPTVIPIQIQYNFLDQLAISSMLTPIATDDVHMIFLTKSY